MLTFQKTVPISFSLLSLLAMAVSGCSRQHITNANIDALNANFARAQKLSDDRRDLGITPKEVESILGFPTKTETYKIPGAATPANSEGLCYIYEQDHQKIVLTFIGGKLTSPAPHFGTQPAAAPDGQSAAAQSKK